MWDGFAVISKICGDFNSVAIYQVIVWGQNSYSVRCLLIIIIQCKLNSVVFFLFLKWMNSLFQPCLQVLCLQMNVWYSQNKPTNYNKEKKNSKKLAACRFNILFCFINCMTPTYCSCPMWIQLFIRPSLFFIICFCSKHCRMRLIFSTLSPPVPLRTQSGLPTPESLSLCSSFAIIFSVENVLIGFLWQKGEIKVFIYTHFSATSLQFTHGTFEFASKVTKNMLSWCWWCLKQLSGFAPDASYMPWGIIFEHILFPNMFCAVENDMNYAIYNITPVYLCYEAVMLFRELLK